MNINVAVQTEHGLFVPVIRVSYSNSCFLLLFLTCTSFGRKFLLTVVLVLQDADKKGLGTIAEEVKQLAQKARDNSLKPADYEVWST